MSDFCGRPDEMLRGIEEIRSVLPEQAVTSLQTAVDRYKKWRSEALADLLQLLEDDDEDPVARTWTDRCNAMRAGVPEHFEDALHEITLDSAGAKKGYGWQLKAMTDEGTFFGGLGRVNAAEVRDYLVANRESLTTYTETLDQKWRTIVDKGNELQSDEQELYQEMVDMTERIAEELTTIERTYGEKARQLGQAPLEAIEKLGGMASDLAGFPEGVGEVAEKLGEWLRAKNQKWLESNDAIRGRAANYRALVQAEKGGVLPLFKETRREVYEYWERNNVERASDWMKKFQASVDNDWFSTCTTPGQQEDAKDFYRAALERVERHLDAVKSVATEFESRWEGVFKGALKPDTIDELVEAAAWRVNAETIVSFGVPSVVKAGLDAIDGYYEPSFAEPLSRLKAAAEALEPGERREQALRNVELAGKRVEESVRARVKEFQRQVAASLNWFAPDEVKKLLDRSELEDALD